MNVESQADPLPVRCLGPADPVPADALDAIKGGVPCKVAPDGAVYVRWTHGVGVYPCRVA